MAESFFIPFRTSINMNLTFTLSFKILLVNLLAVFFMFENKELLANWQQVASFGNIHNDVSCMIKKDNFIFAGTHSTGVMRSSDNGVNWVPVNNGIKTFYMMAFTYTGAGIFCSGAGGVYFSTNNGNNWVDAGKGPTGSFVVSITSKNENIYAGHGLAGVFKSTNNGVNWTRFALGEGDKLRTIIHTDDAFYLSIVTAVLKTTNDGKTFNSANNGIYPYNADMFAYYGDDMYSGTEHGMFHTTNGGDIWFPVNNGLTDTNITALTNSTATIFSGTMEGHVFCSVNKGQSWSDVSDGYADTIVTSLCSDGTYLFAGSASGKIWRRPLSEMITGMNSLSTTLPEKFELYQNHPNPFNPSTTIKFDLAENSDVSLKIFNNKGQVVNTLFKGRLNSGSYSFNFDGENLSSGIYFYGIEAGNYTMIRKMILLK